MACASTLTVANKSTPCAEYKKNIRFFIWPYLRILKFVDWGYEERKGELSANLGNLKAYRKIQKDIKMGQTELNCWPGLINPSHGGGEDGYTWQMLPQAG